MLSALSLPDNDSLEELILEGIGKELYRGELSQNDQCFYILYSRARDCRESDAPIILERLKQMYFFS